MNKEDGYLQNLTDRATQSRIRDFTAPAPLLPYDLELRLGPYPPAHSHGTELDRAILPSAQFTILSKGENI